MPPIVLTLLQALFLLLLYVFVARVVRAVLRDTAGARPRAVPLNTPRPAAPAAPSRRRKARVPPSELVVHVPSGRPRVVALDGQAPISFGRSPSSTVVLDDAYVSDDHAVVYDRDGEWLLADAGSTNGTFLNQVKVTTPTPIAAGDQFALGKTVVQVRR